MRVISIVLLVLAAGCVSGSFPPDDTARPAAEVPSAFFVREGTELRRPKTSDACRNPMVDPRDRTEVRLVRSQADRGDYEVPPGRYGVGARELLRLDCRTGEVIGIVRGE